MKRKWSVLAFEPQAHIFPTVLYWLGVLRSSKILRMPIKQMCFIYRDHTLIEAVETGTLSLLGQSILISLAKDNKFLNTVVSENKKRIPLLLKSADLFDLDLKKFTNNQLIKDWQDYTEKFQGLMAWSAMGTIMEYEYPVLSKYLEQLLKKKIKDISLVGQAMSILTSPTQKTSSQKEVNDLLNIKLGNKKNWGKKLKKHQQKYYWVAFGYDGPGWSLADIKKRFDDLPVKKKKLQSLLWEEKVRLQDLRKRQCTLIHKLKLNSEEKRLFHSIRILGYWKFERKFMLQKTQGLAENFLLEVATRKYCSLPQVKMLLPREMKSFILKDQPKISNLNNRIKLSIVQMKGQKVKVLTGPAAKMLADEIIRSQKVSKKITKIKGDVAYPGKTMGKVILVERASDMDKFKKGDILISSGTSPELIPAMKKAAAIITETGGITCHAAIISRELRTPCIIGTKIATQVFKDGDKVEVDAERGIVKKIK
ncbi:MAG: PEP-utilizing enzyme [bacterium]|nr:PEP-utilizing enzyme [bacterium]